MPVFDMIILALQSPSISRPARRSSTSTSASTTAPRPGRATPTCRSPHLPAARTSRATPGVKCVQHIKVLFMIKKSYDCMRTFCFLYYAVSGAGFWISSTCHPKKNTIFVGLHTLVFRKALFYVCCIEWNCCSPKHRSNVTSLDERLVFAKYESSVT